MASLAEELALLIRSLLVCFGHGGWKQLTELAVHWVEQTINGRRSPTRHSRHGEDDLRRK